MATIASDAKLNRLQDGRAAVSESLRSALDVATTAGLVGMPLARWHGWLFAEAVVGLCVATGVAARLLWPRPFGIRARLLEPALLALWALSFAATAYWSEPPRPTLADLLAEAAPDGFVRQLSTCGPLSVLADESWYRVVQGTDQATGLFVVDDSGLSLWLNATTLPTGRTVDEAADELASDAEAQEPLRELERRSGSVDGFPSVERLYADDDADELRLLVVFERDGHLIAGTGASPGLDSREGVETIRRIVRTVRACGDVRDDAPSLLETLSLSAPEAVR